MGWKLKDLRSQGRDAKVAIGKIVNLRSANESSRSISSNYGFSVSYDSDLIEAEATLLDGDRQVAVLQESVQPSADYLRLLFYPRSIATPTGNFHFSELELATDTNPSFFAQNKVVYGNDLSDIELATKYFEPKAADKISPTLLTLSEETIGGVVYRKLTYEIIDSHFVTTKQTLVQYVTVQNGLPYLFKLTTTSKSNEGEIEHLNAVLKSVTFSKPTKTTETTSIGGTVSLASSDTPEGLVNVPSSLSGETALRIVAKAQPAVVRIASINCMDLEIKKPNKQPGMNIKNACGVVTGSGSIVSRDGYISTNGHVVKVKPNEAFSTYIGLATQSQDFKPLKLYLRYLVDAGIMSADQINGLLDALNAGDETAGEKLLLAAESIPTENIVATNAQNSYAIQLGDKPVKPKLAGTKAEFDYSDTIVKADLVDYDFDPNSAVAGKQDLSEAKTSDVAVLKIESGDYPTIKLGSIDRLALDSLITAIGFPAFVDGGLQTTKTKTFPSATQGSVLQIASDSTVGDRKIVLASLPIAQGNSGGPALDAEGKQVGLTTYSTESADPEAGISKFSTGGILRDIADYKALLAKNGIVLDADSGISNIWDVAINDFAQAHYKDAVENFALVKQKYPANYLAQPFIDLSNAKIASGLDASPSDSYVSYLLGATGVVTFAACVIGVMLVLHARRGTRLFVQQHMPVGDVPVMPYVAPSVVSPQQMMPQQPPQQYTAQPVYAPPPTQQPAPVVQTIEGINSPSQPGQVVSPTQPPQQNAP